MDDTARRLKVQEARNIIYNKGYVVNSSKVDDLLKAESYVPTEVSPLLYYPESSH